MDRPVVRFLGAMACSHDGYHAIRTAYDRQSGVLLYFWTCERCGARLNEARREEYRPSFDPQGHKRLLAPGAG